jgi:hypothetical protein
MEVSVWSSNPSLSVQSPASRRVGMTPPENSPQALYDHAVRELIKDAYKRRAVHYLAPVLTWALAGLGSDLGQAACGDIVMRLGLSNGWYRESTLANGWFRLRIQPVDATH